MRHLNHVLAALALMLPAAPALAQEPPPLRAIVVEGATAWDNAGVERIVRVHPGERLHRDPAALAQALEDRYRASGYLGAEVEGSYDAATETLRFRVDEGRLAEIVLEGVDAGAQDTVRARLALETCKVLLESDVRAAVARVEDASGGALERADWPNYVVETTAEGARLRLRFLQRHVQLAVVPGGGPGAPGNPVDGLAPWLGVELTRYDARRSHHPSAYVRGSWGLESHQVRWALGARVPLGARLVAGYERHEIPDSDDRYQATVFEQAPGTVLLLNATGDYFLRHGDEGWLFARVSPFAQAGVAFRNDRHAPLVDDDADEEALLRPQAVGGLSRSLLATLRWARGGPLFDAARPERESFLQRDPWGLPLGRLHRVRADASFEWASADALGGDFTFRRLILHARGEHAASPRLRLRGRALAAFTGGAPPPQRALALGGPGSLRARGYDEMPGARLAVGTVEAALEAPGKLPSPVAFYDGGLAWGEGSLGAGWRSDVGLGLEWPSGRDHLVRVDAAWAVDPLPGRDRFRWLARLRLPF